MKSPTLSVDATLWLLIVVAVVCLVSLSYSRYGRCPACRTGMRVPRKGRHGPFVGCTNYPQCRGGTLTSGARFPLATRGKGPLPPLPRRRGPDWNLILLRAIGVVLVVLVLSVLSLKH
jgi:hypothetical protein